MEIDGLFDLIWYKKLKLVSIYLYNLIYVSKLLLL